MARSDQIATYAWETHEPRTLVSATPATPTTRAEAIAYYVWQDYTPRTLTGGGPTFKPAWAHRATQVTV